MIIQNCMQILTELSLIEEQISFWEKLITEHNLEVEYQALLTNILHHNTDK